METQEHVTYNALIKPIPYPINLANVADQKPCTTCESCAIIIPNRRRAQRGRIQTGYERVDLYPDFPELKTSAKAGCGLCRFIRKNIRNAWAVRPMEEWGVGPIREKDGLWDELLDAAWDRRVKIHKVAFNLEDIIQSSSLTSASTGSGPADCVVVSLGLEFGPATPFVSPETSFIYEEIGQALSFKVFDSQDLQGRVEDPQRRLPSSSTLSKPNLELISKWVDDCKSSHTMCRLTEPPWLPTRLLDVGSTDGMQLPRLVDTAEIHIQEPYAALSHMWGDPNQGHVPPVRTLRSTYEEMKSGIPWLVMSKNFVDAVIATRELGIRYIWIDSLCIIQDSSDDWHEEAKTMYKVYKFAEITLIATSATSANDGFLERQLSNMRAIKVGYSLDTTGKPAASMILCEHDSSDSGNWSSDIEGSQWNKRGWTLQERSVSTRMLHFCKTKLYFECRGCLRSEEKEPLGRARTFEMWPRDDKFQDWPFEDPKTKTERRKRLYKRWIHAVTEYSQRRLTKETDRLLAIQVLAGEMSASVDDVYISYAGMWLSQLERELLWQVLSRPRSVRNHYIAPSWSWASLDAAIKWEAGSVDPKPSNSSVPRGSFRVLQVIDTRVSQVPLHPLKVKAFLQPIAFILECDNDDRWINGSRFTFPYDIYIPQYSLRSRDCTQGSGVETSVADLSIAERRKAVEEQTFIKISEARLDFDDNDDLTKSHRLLSYLHISHAIPSGLVLEAVTDMEGTWKRVGVATVFKNNGDLFVDPCFTESVEPLEVTII